MGLIGGRLAAKILARYEWKDVEPARDYRATQKLETLLGRSVWEMLRGRTVLDFGCGHGEESIAIAQGGAANVVGVDIREEVLVIARQRLATSGIGNCVFTTHVNTQFDVIVSLDAFEHFSDPCSILRHMAALLKPEGRVLVSFGPPWYHPLGGHFPLFPWAHLLMTEQSLMHWRAQYKTDGAKTFGEVAGGLNQMSIKNFERLVAASPLKFERLELVPIRAATAAHGRLTREFFTSTVRCVLVHSSKAL